MIIITRREMALHFFRGTLVDGGFTETGADKVIADLEAKHDPILDKVVQMVGAILLEGGKPE